MRKDILLVFECSDHHREEAVEGDEAGDGNEEGTQTITQRQGHFRWDVLDDSGDRECARPFQHAVARL